MPTKLPLSIIIIVERNTSRPLSRISCERKKRRQAYLAFHEKSTDELEKENQTLMGYRISRPSKTCVDVARVYFQDVSRSSPPLQEMPKTMSERGQHTVWIFEGSAGVIYGTHAAAKDVWKEGSSIARQGIVSLARL
jgi:hypothetical protein